MAQQAAALRAAPSTATRTSAAVLCLIPLAIFAAGWLFRLVWAWIATMILLIVFVVLVGHHIVGLWRGAFIDDRNMISLSRFQTIVWTVLVLGGFLAAALYNVRGDQPEPLGISLPPQL
jgi:hypothetical protein